MCLLRLVLSLCILRVWNLLWNHFLPPCFSYAESAVRPQLHLVCSGLVTLSSHTDTFPVNFQVFSGWSHHEFSGIFVLYSPGPPHCRKALYHLTAPHCRKARPPPRRARHTAVKHSRRAAAPVPSPALSLLPLFQSHGSGLRAPGLSPQESLKPRDPFKMTRISPKL